MRVRAKRLGWDEETSVTRNDILDPYDYPDPWVEGNLEKRQVESPYIEPYVNHLVAGQPVDPATIERLDGPSANGNGSTPPRKRLQITTHDVDRAEVLWDELMPENSGRLGSK